MAIAVAVPDLGHDMAEVLVAEWYLEDGANVREGEALCRVECGFIAVELEAEETGLLRLVAPAGSIECPGAVLGHIVAVGEAIPSPADREDCTDDIAAAIGEAARESEFAALEPADGETAAPGEPLHEFEEALIEAVVVPFPRRFAHQPAVAWDTAPGDAVNFESPLFEGEEGQAERLPEPGGSIPGLLLWEPEDERAGAAAYASPVEERFARISDEAAASAQVLTMSIELDVTEPRRMLAVCAREWRGAGEAPLTEDILLRALGIALAPADARLATGGLLIAGPESDVATAVAGPGLRPLREAVEARCRGGDADFESADWVLVSLAAHGIATAAPRLDGGRQVAFAAGAPNAAGVMTLTAAYDSRRWSEGSAARLLGRVRELFEAPYAMLV